MLLPELGTYIVAQGISGVTSLGTDTFLSRIPPDPDVCLTLIHYGGLPDESTVGTAGAINIEYPRFQAVCRGVRDDYAGPMAMANSVKIAFQKVLNTTLSGVRYLAITLESGPMFLRRDTNDRVEVVANFQVLKAQSTS